MKAAFVSTTVSSEKLYPTSWQSLIRLGVRSVRNQGEVRLKSPNNPRQRENQPSISHRTRCHDLQAVLRQGPVADASWRRWLALVAVMLTRELQLDSLLGLRNVAGWNNHPWTVDFPGGSGLSNRRRSVKRPCTVVPVPPRKPMVLVSVLRGCFFDHLLIANVDFEDGKKKENPSHLLPFRRCFTRPVLRNLDGTHYLRRTCRRSHPEMHELK